LNSGSHSGRIADYVGTKKKILYVLYVINTGMQKIQKLGWCVLDTEGSRKHEDE
jgi:hypothetical protein